MSAVARGLLALAIIVPIAGASIHSVCNLYFACGCAPLWAGGTDHCNIHAVGPPDCPWCSGHGFMVAGAVMLAGILAGVGAGLRLSERRTPPIVLGFAGYALSSWIASLL